MAIGPQKEITVQDKPVALVTGANKGIGLQIAKDLAAHGFIVFVGSRNLEHGETAAKSVGADARALHLDVLVNNAAVSHAGKPGRPLEDVAKSGRATVASLDEVRAVFETNVFGVIAVTQAMLPLLREAPAGRIVNVSSGAGSLTRNADPTNPHRAMFGVTYSASKTTLNAITLAFALDLESTRIKVNAACPGFTATDLNNFQGTRTVQQAAGEPVRLALLDANDPTGTFSNEDGPLPW